MSEIAELYSYSLSLTHFCCMHTRHATSGPSEPAAPEVEVIDSLLQGEPALPIRKYAHNSRSLGPLR